MTSTDRRSSPREVRRRSPGAARLLLLSHNSTRKSMFRPKVLGHTVGRRAEFDTIREFIRNGTAPVLCSDRAAVVTVDWDGGSNLAGTLVRNRMDAPPEDRQGRAFWSSLCPPVHRAPFHPRMTPPATIATMAPELQHEEPMSEERCATRRWARSRESKRPTPWLRTTRR
jgi:hypothetical protein